MGYRSDVKLILTDKGMEMLRAKVPKPAEDEVDWMAEAVYDSLRIGGDKYWLVEWDSVKWYDDWEDYKVPCAVLDLRNELQEMEEPFKFIRAGEDYGDIEMDGVYDDMDMPYLGLKREIEVEY